MTLVEIMDKHAAPRGHGHGDKNGDHSYGPVYETLLAPYRQAGSILEIGLGWGLSLAVWAEYFGPEAQIFGVDKQIRFPRRRFDSRVHIFKADATTPAVATLLAPFRFDVVIDDGSHVEAEQKATFNLLKSQVKRGGIYVIEDLLDPEHSIPRLKALHPNCEVIDRRRVKGCYADVLLVFRFP